MIDWLTKLPEWAIAPAVVGGIWFGFNYAVLAERAMAKDEQIESGRSCLAAIDQYQSSFEMPTLGLGRQFGVPDLDRFEDLARSLYRPRILSQAEKLARCECAMLSTRDAARFDYAVSTSSFRIISAKSVGSLRKRSVDLVMSGACGELPSGRGR